MGADRHFLILGERGLPPEGGDSGRAGGAIGAPSRGSGDLTAWGRDFAGVRPCIRCWRQVVNVGWLTRARMAGAGRITANRATSHHGESALMGLRRPNIWPVSPCRKSLGLCRLASLRIVIPTLTESIAGPTGFGLNRLRLVGRRDLTDEAAGLRQSTNDRVVRHPLECGDERLHHPQSA